MYDHIILRAGSAGCVLTARLTEAGPPDTGDEIHIPVALASLFKNRWDWDCDSEPEPALGGPTCHMRDGRSLNPLGDAFLQAAEQAGHQRNADFNGAGRAVGVEISRGSRLEQLRAELEEGPT